MRFVGGGVGHQKYGALIKENISYISTDIMDSAQDAMILNEMEAKATAAEKSKTQNSKGKNNADDSVHEAEDQDNVEVNAVDEDSDDFTDDLASQSDDSESGDDLESVFDFS